MTFIGKLLQPFNFTFRRHRLGLSLPVIILDVGWSHEEFRLWVFHQFCLFVQKNEGCCCLFTSQRVPLSIDYVSTIIVNRQVSKHNKRL